MLTGRRHRQGDPAVGADGRRPSGVPDHKVPAGLLRRRLIRRRAGEDGRGAPPPSLHLTFFKEDARPASDDLNHGRSVCSSPAGSSGRSTFGPLTTATAHLQPPRADTPFSPTPRVPAGTTRQPSTSSTTGTFSSPRHRAALCDKTHSRPRGQSSRAIRERAILQ